MLFTVPTIETLLCIFMIFLPKETPTIFFPPLISFTACFTWPSYSWPLHFPFSPLVIYGLASPTPLQLAFDYFFTQSLKALSSNLVYSSSLLIHNPFCIIQNNYSSEHLLQFQHILHLWVDISTILVLLKEIYYNYKQLMKATKSWDVATGR